MIILDNSVLSAFTRLKLLSSLKLLFSTIFISKEIIEEYSNEWKEMIPNWVKILSSNRDIPLENIPLSLSSADLSIIKLALEYNMPIASDDRPLRNYAIKLEIKITGSLGLLKLLYKKRIIKSREKYIHYLNSLQEDIYISEDLLKWALDE